MAFTKEQKNYLNKMGKVVDSPARQEWLRRNHAKSIKSFQEQVKERMLREGSYPTDTERYYVVICILLFCLDLILLLK